jgi:hypothetical protein
MDSEESNPPILCSVAGRYTTNRAVVPASLLGWESSPEPLKHFTNTGYGFEPGSVIEQSHAQSTLPHLIPFSYIQALFVLLTILVLPAHLCEYVGWGFIGNYRRII